MENKPDLIETIHREGFDPKQQGRSWWLPCPFHPDRTPSMKIDPDRQTFFCFSCNEGGDVIVFIQRLHGLSFKEALKHLGMETGKPPKIDHREKKKRELVKEFRAWRDAYYMELCRQRLFYESMTRDLKDMEQVELVAWMFDELPLIEHKLDILFNGTDEEKYDLYREEIENGKF